MLGASMARLARVAFASRLAIVLLHRNDRADHSGAPGVKRSESVKSKEAIMLIVLGDAVCAPQICGNSLNFTLSRTNNVNRAVGEC
jgi:hypothetical protein